MTWYSTWECGIEIAQLIDILVLINKLKYFSYINSEACPSWFSPDC